MFYFKQLLWFISLRKFQILLGIICVMATSILGVFQPKLLGIVIDQINNGKLSDEFWISATTIQALIAFSFFFLTIIWLLCLFNNVILVEKLLRIKLFEHLTKMTSTFFRRYNYGHIINISSTDTPNIGNAFGFGLSSATQVIVGGLVVIVTMLSTSVYMTIAACIPLLIIVYGNKILGNLVQSYYQNLQETKGLMNQHSLETVSAIRLIRSYCQKENHVSEFKKIGEEHIRRSNKAILVRNIIPLLGTLVVGISQAVSLACGITLLFYDQITIGQLIAFNMYIVLLIWPIESYGQSIDTFMNSTSALKRYNDVTDYSPEITNPPNSIENIVPSHIKFDDLSFKYPESIAYTLKNIDLTIEQGQTIGIVGKTGSGKSTLLKQLLLQNPIPSNSIFVNKVPIEDISLETIRSWIGYVPQDYMLFSKSIKENIAFGNPVATLEQIEQVIEATALKNDLLSMPDGIDTLIGEKGIKLSGGQKQRIALARALLRDPEILLLDDSLSAVDAESEAKILTSLLKIRKGKTTVIVSHKLSTISNANQIVVLKAGEISERGNHSELLKIDGWYKKQFDQQLFKGQ